MRIFVGNLPFKATKEDVIDLFSQAGKVDESQSSLPLERGTNRPRGFAFIEMPDQREAEEAIERLHGYNFDGRAINVSKARPASHRDRGSRPQQY